MNRIPRVRTPRPFLVALVGFTLSPSVAHAQEPAPPRWAVSVGGGAMLPAWLYNARVTAKSSSESFSTMYSERTRIAPLVGGALRYRPQSGFGAFIGVDLVSASTEASYSGGRGGPQQIGRSVRIWTFTAGMAVRLGQWADGAGGVAYLVAPVVTHHTLDLSNGHRDVFATQFGAPADAPLQWRSRSWTGWGLSLGVTARFPVTRDLGLRVGVNSLVLPAAADDMESLEADEVERLAGRRPVFDYSGFTTYYPSIQVAVDYVLSRARPGPPAAAAPRPPDPRAEESAEARAARELAARGDTAAAIATLRARVRQTPHDPSAWRELALLLAVIAESDSTAAPGAWEALQHAVSLNPDDVQLLAAYGRTRALVERTQAVTEAPPEPFTVSAVAVQVAEAGGLSLSVEASGLPLSPDGRARYRVTIEVLDPAGERVPLRPAAAPDSAPTGALELERGADSPSVAERIALLLARSQPGTHTVRVRVTSLASGRSVTRTAAFEIR